MRHFHLSAGFVLYDPCKRKNEKRRTSELTSARACALWTQNIKHFHRWLTNACAFLVQSPFVYFLFVPTDHFLPRSGRMMPHNIGTQKQNAYGFRQPITVAARSKASTVFARSNTGIVGSNPTRGMDVCLHLFCVCVVLCVGSGLATGWSPSKES
jgi:hypothetical protein